MSSISNQLVVVGIGGSADASAAVCWAALDAARHRGPLHIVHALGLPADFGPGIVFSQFDLERYRHAGNNTLDLAYDSATIAAATIGALDITTELVEASPVTALHDRSKDARLLVVGTRGRRSVGRGLLGSVSTSLARHAQCPVAVIPQRFDAATHPNEVAVGTDGSVSSALAIEIAFDQAAHRGASLLVVHTWSESFRYISRDEMQQAGEELLAQNLAGYSERYPNVPVRRLVVADRPDKRLIAVSGHASLIVVGSRGRGGFAGLPLGSVSLAVLHGAEIPVLIARATA